METELGKFAEEWEKSKGTKFLVRGVDVKKFVEEQKLEYMEKMKEEKSARKKAKKETLLHETRFGCKPVISTMSRAKASLSRLKNSIETSMRSLKAGIVWKGVRTRYGGKKEEKNKLTVRNNQLKFKKGVELNLL